MGKKIILTESQLRKIVKEQTEQHNSEKKLVIDNVAGLIDTYWIRLTYDDYEYEKDGLQIILQESGDGFKIVDDPDSLNHYDYTPEEIENAKRIVEEYLKQTDLPTGMVLKNIKNPKEGGEFWDY